MVDKGMESIAAGKDGVLRLAGHDVRALVVTFGSPLVVLLEEVVRANCRAYISSMARYPRTRVYYASKAFLTTGFCRLIEEEGLCLDVVSEGELATAMAAGFPAEKILLHGNAKTKKGLASALEAGVGRIVIDNMDEIDRLAKLTDGSDHTVHVMIRVTPGVEPHTHKYIRTGQIDSKFGFNIAGGAAEEAAMRILSCTTMSLVGVHCHIGSQIFDQAPFHLAARTMMAFYARVKKDLGAPLDELNLGGGVGISYMPEDKPMEVASHIEDLSDAVLKASKEHGVEPPVLCDEPGRSIVGSAGVTLYTVQSKKRIEGVRNYVSVDGGMTDNPRFALYGARHDVVAATRMKEERCTEWSVSGQCCESGDMLRDDVMLPDLEAGDLLAFLTTGAYTYSMASHYNRVPKPAVVLVGPGRVDLLAEREKPEDMARLDRIPAWFGERKEQGRR